MYGTGIGEIVVEDKKELAPATQPMPETNAVAIGVTESTKLTVGLRVVNPKNFLIDPTATTIEDALGCAIEKFVSIHKVVEGMELVQKIEALGSPSGRPRAIVAIAGAGVVN